MLRTFLKAVPAIVLAGNVCAEPLRFGAPVTSSNRAEIANLIRDEPTIRGQHNPPISIALANINPELGQAHIVLLGTVDGCKANGCTLLVLFFNTPFVNRSYIGLRVPAHTVSLGASHQNQTDLIVDQHVYRWSGKGYYRYD